MKSEIFIPTYGRPNNQKTFECLSDVHKKNTTFIIRPEEEKLFKNRRYIVCSKKGAPAARQAAIEHSSARAVVMLDDDLSFSKRIDSWSLNNPRLIKAEIRDVHDGIDWLIYKIGAYALSGLAPRGNNNTEKERWERECSRVMRAFAVDRRVLIKYKIRFDRYKYWEDFHVNLSLLRLGYKNIVNTALVNDAGTNTKGGCSSYRKLSEMLKVREQFLKEHGDFARRNDKSAKSWGEGFKDSDTVPDMVIQWRKAYELSTRSDIGGRKG